MKIAFVHDWLNGMRGGEKCLEAMLEIFPGAPIFTLLCEPEKISERIKQSKITTSWISRLPDWRRRYRYYLPFFPRAMKSLNLNSSKLIVSISHCAAKSVQIPKGATHICYCLTPMRYLWGFYEEYFGEGPYHWLKLFGLKRLLNRLRKWDVESSKKVDYFIAISNHVAQRIKAIYGRDSVVIYPPVDANVFYYDDTDEREGFFLIVSALVPYKKIDLAVQAFNELNYPLKIIGAGTELEKLKKMSNPNIEFLGWKSNSELRKYYARAQALVFPGEEDFGITPLESQACGTPVIAFKKGGVLETVLDGRTGLFFEKQDKSSLIQAIEKFKDIIYDRQILRENALEFRTEVFQEKIKKFLISKNLLGSNF
jgi:glycosyltransferase involved in cell wall biosynthesis